MDQRAEGWHADPFGRHEWRFFDGVRWTPYVKDGDDHAVDEPVGIPAADADAGQARSLLTEPVLVVSQRAKLVELHNEYDVRGADGVVLGRVREVGQGKGKLAARALTGLDAYLGHRLEIVDPDGRMLLGVSNPAVVSRRMRFRVTDHLGSTLGEVVQQWSLGKARFGFEDNGSFLGYLSAQNLRAWNFTLTDRRGVEIGKVTKTWSGLTRTVFTTADDYAVELNQPIPEPLRSLAVASALVVDTALKQGAGLGIPGLGIAGLGAAVIGSD